MKVKIGDIIYDSEKEPIMIILSKGEREQIANMSPEATRYCSYPDTDEWMKDNYKAIKKWMSEGE